MNIRIKKEVFHKFNHNLRIAFIHVQGLDNKTKLRESKHLLHEAQQLVHLTFNKETVKNHYLVTPWAVAQQEYGAKAKHYHTSVERLVKKVLARRSITAQNVLVNLVRYLALRHLIPMSVDDTSKLNGNLTFELSSGRKKVGPLRLLKKGALYYHDEKNVLGAKLDYWKSPKTGLTAKTTDALIHIEALPPITSAKLNQVIREMTTLIKSFCGAKTSVVILDKKKSKITM